MMKHILFTLSILAGTLLANAEVGPRFKYGDFWYESIGDGICQTAALEGSENWIIRGEWNPEIIDSKTGQNIWNNDYQGPNKNNTSYDVFEIPSLVYDEQGKPYTVTRIGDFSYAGGPNSNKLVIPNTVTEIGNGAFYQWYNTKSIDFGTGIKKIGKGAFVQIGAGPSLEIPSSVEEIDDFAFAFCGSLNSLTFNEGLKRIGNSAFQSCGALGGILKFPESLEVIDNRAFYNVNSISGVEFGNKLQRVGDEAFYRINVPPARDGGQDFWILPPSLTDIGAHAFNTQNKVGTFTDIYYANSNPNDIDDFAFGLIEREGHPETYSPDYWIYATVCLHVPVGTIDLYRSKKGWCHFKCIIDDILPQDPEAGDHTSSDDPLTYILDYLYLVPGDDIDLNSLIGETVDTFEWNPIPENDSDERDKILTLDKDGKGVAKAYGNVIAIGKRKSSRLTDGNQVQEVQAPIGAVIIFVCPTLTVVYDKDNTTDAPVGQSSNSRVKAPMKAQADADSPEALIKSNTTYSHPVVFNSLPKVQVNPTPEIIIEKVERASIDETNSNYIESLTQVEDDYRDTTPDAAAGEYSGSIVPVDPIAENRLIVVTLTVPYGIATSVEEIELDSKISIRTSQHHLSIIGADENSTVNLANIQGQVVYNGTNKEFDLEPGIYIISVEDVAFKAIVK